MHDDISLFPISRWFDEFKKLHNDLFDAIMAHSNVKTIQGLAEQIQLKKEYGDVNIYGADEKFIECRRCHHVYIPRTGDVNEAFLKYINIKFKRVYNAKINNSV